MSTIAKPWVWRQPLVPAAGALALGLAVGRSLDTPPLWLVVAALLAWATWSLLEAAGRRSAPLALAAAILLCGAATWAVNQRALEPTNIARWATDHESPITARVRVTVPPAAISRAGAVWTGQIQSVLADGGWRPVSGLVRVKTRDAVQRGALLELHGWLKRPDGPENPGAIDLRQLLAADRIFAQIRVPRATGAVLLDPGSAGQPWLTQSRAFLRAKLLEHTAREDVEAGYAMEALLLGVREPVIDDVTQAFSNAGVAHLLAISGAHVVFVAAIVWWLLRWLPLRPRLREALVALAVITYVLATPCGPPVIRAAIAVVMVVIARMLGRPRVNLNMLAAALLVVLMWRPADVLDAGFQLSFAGTAALILFAERAYAALFGAWLEREKTLAALAGTRLARAQVRTLQTLCALVVANAIGVASTLPLVAFHFQKINPLGVLTGIVALPAVALAMIASALQVAAELLSSTVGGWSAPFTAAAGRLMIWTVEHLAMIPGSAISIRPPPAWLVACALALWIVWAARRRLRLSRAAIANFALFASVLTAAWYTWTMPVGTLRIEVLRVGIGSAMIVRMPDGALWVADAGSCEIATPMERAITPALRMEGAGRIAGLLLIGLDEPHARDAAPVIARYRPATLLLPLAVWQRRQYTRAGGEVETAAPNACTLADGQSLALNGVRITAAADGLLLWEFAGRRIAMLDGKSVGALLRWLDARERCDTFIVTGAESKEFTALLQRAQDPIVRAGTVITVDPRGLHTTPF